MKNQEIAEAWINYYLAGSENTEWAVSELDELSKQDSAQTWDIIQRINSIDIPDPTWHLFVDGAVGCGPLENILAIYPDEILDAVLAEAKGNQRLRTQLDVIYESSLPGCTWQKIQAVLNPEK